MKPFISKIFLLLFLLLRIQDASGQVHNITREFKPDSYNFWYSINDTSEYLGSAWTCTLPYSAYIKNAYWDKCTDSFTVEGFFGMRSIPSDTSLGQDGAQIILYNPITHKSKLVGITLNKQESGKGYDGFFNVTFKKEKDDILIIGIEGRTGVATAYELDRIIKRFENLGLRTTWVLRKLGCRIRPISCSI